eukprot:3139142-Rhodomonas_salina.1
MLRPMPSHVSPSSTSLFFLFLSCSALEKGTGAWVQNAVFVWVHERQRGAAWYYLTSSPGTAALG